MLAPIFRSPIAVAAAAFATGLVMKWIFHVKFAIGGTMVVVLWLLPFMALAARADVFPKSLGRDPDRHRLSAFLEREHWLELLAVLTLPGFGFAADVATLSLATAVFAAIGFIGIIASIQLILIERKKRAAGPAL